MDGTRTRDPRRDRPGRQVNAGAGLRPIRIPKTHNFGSLLARRVIALFQNFRHDKGPKRCHGKQGMRPVGIKVAAPCFVAKNSVCSSDMEAGTARLFRPIEGPWTRQPLKGRVARNTGRGASYEPPEMLGALPPCSYAWPPPAGTRIR